MRAAGLVMVMVVVWTTVSCASVTPTPWIIPELPTGTATHEKVVLLPPTETRPVIIPSLTPSPVRGMGTPITVTPRPSEPTDVPTAVSTSMPSAGHIECVADPNMGTLRIKNWVGEEDIVFVINGTTYQVPQRHEELETPKGYLNDYCIYLPPGIYSWNAWHRGKEDKDSGLRLSAKSIADILFCKENGLLLHQGCPSSGTPVPTWTPTQAKPG